MASNSNEIPHDTSPAQAHDRPADWAEPGIGGSAQHKFIYWLMRIGGKARGYHMGNIAALWFVAVRPSIRRRCGYYLDRRFPEHRGKLRRFLDAYRLVRTYAATLVDMMVLGMFGPKSLSAICPDHDRLKSLAQSEHGFVLIHAHVGCWQVGMSTLGEFNKHVSIVMLPEAQTASLFDPRTVARIDPRTGLQSTLEMTEALLKGGIVAMMGDRTFGNEHNVVRVKFLGGYALFPITPYRLASATGVPVVVMTAPKVATRSYELRLAKVIEVPPRLGRSAINYAPYAQQFADCLEGFMREYPWQFYNFYDMWRETEHILKE